LETGRSDIATSLRKAHGSGKRDSRAARAESFSKERTGKLKSNYASYESPFMTKKKKFFSGAIALFAIFSTTNVFAGDADINLPSLQDVSFLVGLSGRAILFSGLIICAIGAAFGILQYK
jgi:hypothetical protein